MLKRKHFRLSLIFLFIFFLVTVSINFFHIEKTIIENANCPAGNFLHSTLTTAHINFFFMPAPGFLNLIQTVDFFHYNDLFAIHTRSRSPPLNQEPDFIFI